MILSISAIARMIVLISIRSRRDHAQIPAARPIVMGEEKRRSATSAGRESDGRMANAARLRQDDDLRSDPDAIVKINNVAVRHSYTPRGYCRADGVWLV